MNTPTNFTEEYRNQPFSRESFLNNSLNYITRRNSQYGVSGVAGKLKLGDNYKENFLIGNIDEDYDLILPLNNYITSWTETTVNSNLPQDPIPNLRIPVEEEHVMSNFVFDCLKNLFFDIATEKTRLIKTDSFFYNLQIKRSFSPIQSMWMTNIMFLSKNFKQYSISRLDVNNSIKNINNFIFQFIKFLDKTLNFTCVNRSSLILNSRKNYLSGLKVSFSLEDPFDYSNTYRFYLDKNFNEYAAFCRFHGLLIDKFSPWTVYPDFSSKNLLDSLARYGINSEFHLYKINYKKAFLDDIESLIFLFYYAYNNFVEENTVYVTDLKNTCSGRFFKVEGTRETEVTYEYFKNFIDMKYWLRIYAFFRHKEIFSSMDQNLFDNVVDDAYNAWSLTASTDLPSKIINDAFKPQLVEMFTSVTSGQFTQEYLNSIKNSNKKIIL